MAVRALLLHLLSAAQKGLVMNEVELYWDISDIMTLNSKDW